MIASSSRRSHLRSFTLGLIGSFVLLSASLPQAWAGSMTIAGDASVSPSGAATYAIPLELAPGIAGLGPKLSIGYSSQAGEGVMGVGWGIQGLSTVTRCARTYAQDNFKGGTFLDANDRYCLDGQRLRPVPSGESTCPVDGGQSGVMYRTEIESFSRICGYGSQGAAGHERFKVWTKAGLVHQYGYTGDARIEAPGQAQGTGTVLFWAIDRTLDRRGNFVKYTYTEDNTNGWFRPLRIRYSGNDTYSLEESLEVEFNYDDSSPSTPERVYARQFTMGSLLQKSSRLINIVARVKDGTSSADWRQVRKWTFTYDANGAGRRSRLTSIQECGTTNTSGSCLDTLTINWSTTGPLNASFTHQGTQTPPFTAPDGYPYVPVVGDFDGNGKADIYWFGPGTGGGRLWLDVMTGTNLGTTHWGPDISFSTPVSGDFNADGKTDILWWGGYSMPVVYLSNGDGTFFSLYALQPSGGSWAPYDSTGTDATCASPMSADFNGDGLTDLLWRCTDVPNGSGLREYFQMWMGNADATFTLGASMTKPDLPGPPPAVCVMPGEWNGDGNADLFFYPCYSTETGIVHDTGGSFFWMNAGTGGFNGTNVGTDVPHGFTPQGLDHNADGLTDILWTTATTRELWVNKGNGTYEYHFNPGNANGLLSYSTVSGADFNGDGKTDLWLHNGPYDGRYMLLSTGNINFYNAFDTLGGTGAPIGGIDHQTCVTCYPLIADFSGDGRADIFMMDFDPNNGWNSQRGIYFNNLSLVDLVTEINRGAAAGGNSKYTFGYGSMSDPAVYVETGVTPTYPIVKGGSNAVLANRLSHFPAPGMERRSNFMYLDARAHLLGRGSLGFAQFNQYHWQDNTAVGSITKALIQTTRYSQQVPTVGSVTEDWTWAWTPGIWNLVSYTANNYYAPDANGGDPYGTRRWMVINETTTSEKREPDGTTFISRQSTTNTTAYVDWSGEVPEIITRSYNAQGQLDGFVKTVRSEWYAPDYPSWKFGRLKCSAVKEETPSEGSQTRSSSFTYFSDGLLESETIEPGTTCFDFQGTTDANYALKTTYTYDSWGNNTGNTVQSLVSPPGQGQAPNGYFAPRTTSRTYADTDALGKYVFKRVPVSSTDALGRRTDFAYGSYWVAAPTKRTLFANVTGQDLVTQWTYDNLGRKATETRPDSTKTQWSYNASSGLNGSWGQPVVASSIYSQVYDKNGVTSAKLDQYVYRDGLERSLLKLSRNLEDTNWVHTDDVRYDHLGRVTKAYLPYERNGFALPANAVWSETDYDIVGRKSEVRANVKSSGGAPSGVIKTNFTYNGRIASSVTSSTASGYPNDTPTSTTEKTVDSQGRTITVIQAKGTARETTTTYVYHPFGELKRTTAPGGAQTVLSYDPRGRKSQMVDPNTGTWNYLHDAAGQLVRQTDGKQQVTDLTYDVLGRITARTEPDRTSNFYYDASADASCPAAGKYYGKITRTSTSTNAETRHCFDSVGRPDRNITISGGSSFAESYTYDEWSRPLTVTYPGPTTLKYYYRSTGPLNKIVDASNEAREFWSGIARNAAGQVTAERIGKETGHPTRIGVTITNTYDDLGRRTALSTDTTGTHLVNMTTTFDYLSNVRGRSWWDGASTRSESFTVDELSRLTGVTGASNKTWTYTANGNIATKDGGTYYYGDACGSTRPHAVSRVVGTVNGVTNPYYEYDANGNLQKELGGGCTNGGGTLKRDLTWASYNLPTQIRKYGATTTTLDFVYAAGNERIKQVASVNGTVKRATTPETMSRSRSGARSIARFTSRPRGGWSPRSTCAPQVRPSGASRSPMGLARRVRSSTRIARSSSARASTPGASGATSMAPTTRAPRASSDAASPTTSTWIQSASST